MKWITLVLVFLSSLLLLTSCSSDDNGGDTDPNQIVFGTWNLVELNVNPPQDVNMDGTTSANLLDELNCVSGVLNLRADNSWTLTFDGVVVTTITGGLFNIQCADFTANSSGTWQLQGSRLTLFQGVNSVFYTLSGDTLTNNLGEDLPLFSSEVYQRQ